MAEDVLIARIRSRLERESSDLVAAYLFGSTARGEDGPESDLDLALLYREAPPAQLDSAPRMLEDDLEKQLGRRVQVVTLDSASPDLVHRVLRDGVILLDRDRAHRLRFEVRSQNEYFDMLPILELYRRKARPTG